MAGMGRLVPAGERWWGDGGILTAFPDPPRAVDTLDPHGLQQCRACLASVVEGEIIPRLMLAHRTVAPEPAQAPPKRLGVAEVDVSEFIRLLLVHDTDVAASFLHTRLARGVSLESILLDLMAPAARYLGELWKKDICNFVDVTIALARLQQLLRIFSPSLCDPVSATSDGPKILLGTVPGEQHTFGLFMVEEFFRRAGWVVWGGLPETREDYVVLVAEQWFDVVGLSASCESRLDHLADDIRAVRQASRNPMVTVLVGGQLFLSVPELARQVGADGTAETAQKAVRVAETLVGAASLAAR